VEHGGIVRSIGPSIIGHRASHPSLIDHRISLTEPSAIDLSISDIDLSLSDIDLSISDTDDR